MREADGRTGGRARGAVAAVRVVLLAAALSAGPPVRLSAQTPPPRLSVNANPVTAAPLILHWTTPGGQTRVEVFTINGVPVTSAVLASDTGRWAWDLTTADGRPVANGAYFVAVTLSDNTRLRRRLLVAR